MTINENLKPCPFCGGRAKEGHKGGNGWVIMCESCTVRMDQRTIRHTVEWLREKMIEDWNRRV